MENINEKIINIQKFQMSPKQRNQDLGDQGEWRLDYKLITLIINMETHKDILESLKNFIIFYLLSLILLTFGLKADKK